MTNLILTILFSAALSSCLAGDSLLMSKVEREMKENGWNCRRSPEPGRIVPASEKSFAESYCRNAQSGEGVSIQIHEFDSSQSAAKWLEGLKSVRALSTRRLERFETGDEGYLTEFEIADESFNAAFFRRDDKGIYIGASSANHARRFALLVDKVAARFVGARQIYKGKGLMLEDLRELRRLALADNDEEGFYIAHHDAETLSSRSHILFVAGDAGSSCRKPYVFERQGKDFRLVFPEKLPNETVYCREMAGTQPRIFAVPAGEIVVEIPFSNCSNPAKGCVKDLRIYRYEWDGKTYRIVEEKEENYVLSRMSVK